MFPILSIKRTEVGVDNVNKKSGEHQRSIDDWW